MAVRRKDVEATKAFIRARIGDRYEYGGELTLDPRQGTDCSEVWQSALEMTLGRWQQGRQPEGATTESYRYVPIGGVGPFGTIRVARPEEIPADAVVKLAFHHEGSGGASSHMWGELDGMRIESASNPKGLCTQPTAWEITNPYATAWAYLPGPIIEDGSPVAGPAEPKDTLFADVSEWQVPVGDSYPYRVISIRSNDGTHRDLDWATNYAWCRRAADDGRLAFFYVYFVWRPGVDNVAVLRDMVGQPHPKMVVEIDVESWGGQITGNQSAGLNAAHDEIAAWLGNPDRVSAYGNTGDLNSLWPDKPPALSVRLAAYGSNPAYPGKIAHQYTNGQGYGGGLPEAAPPFGNCDMNSADGYTPTSLAAVHGITTAAPTTPGGISMADANSLAALIGGLDGSGKPLLGPDGADYRRVDALADYEGPAGTDGVGKYGAAAATPEGPNTSRSLLDIGGTTSAKIITRRYVNSHGQRLDLFDLLVGIYQASGEPVVVKGPVTD